MASSIEKIRAPRNRTVTLTPEEVDVYSRGVLRLEGPATLGNLRNRTIHQDLFDILDWLPSNFADLLFLDPPYNLTKTFNSTQFKERSAGEYTEWLDSWMPRLLKTLKPKGVVYICGDWRSSASIQLVAGKYLKIQNRISWEREKGRGAQKNWKNCCEDIWFCTRSDEYVFNVEAVKVKRRVIAPYTDEEGQPKDWDRSGEGNYRLTYPSNLWTDITVPFWSMPENTDHPTQKPEKLLAKIILATSHENDFIFDPFVGSGTASVVAKKLRRQFLGIDVDLMYCCLTEKRLQLAAHDCSIQGYSEGVFWERNSLNDQKGTYRRSANQNLLPLGLTPADETNET